MYYSLIESAKANNLELHDYLRRMLKRLPYAETVDDFEALLPWNISMNDNLTSVNDGG